ncbi:MAG: YihY/virulence factor BrkB family protein [Chloroflexi bacterium]|nr:YihY/virulence factor BrkB family protein [Chloroflexota bacterium]
MRTTSVAALLRETYTNWSTDNCLRLGASLAFYTLSSLIPLLLIVLAILTFVLHFTGGGQDLEQRLLHQITAVVHNPDLATQITTGLTSRTADAATKGTLGTVVGVVALLVTASGVFAELDEAFNIIWKAPNAARRSGLWGFIRAKFLSFTLVLGVAFLLLVSQVLTAVLTGLHDVLPAGLLWAILNSALQVGFITLIFTLLFKFLPDTHVAWSDVWLGALLTALLWLAGQQLLTLYFKYFTGFSSYGALGGVLAFLFYVYYSSQILFLGGEYTYVYAQTHAVRTAVAAAGGTAEMSPAAGRASTAQQQAARRATGHYAAIATAGLVGLAGGVAIGGVGLVVGMARGARKLRGLSGS